MKYIEYVYDSNYAYALLFTNQDGLIIDSAPIYKKLVGKNIADLKYGVLHKLGEDKWFA